tara:strand:- start:25 stop:285 length:261 start_codon:yes stop_codon:yes gene_type:complete
LSQPKSRSLSLGQGGAHRFGTVLRAISPIGRRPISATKIAGAEASDGDPGLTLGFAERAFARTMPARLCSWQNARHKFHSHKSEYY